VVDIELPYPLVMNDGGGLFMPLTLFVHSTSEMAGNKMAVQLRPDVGISAQQPLQITVQRNGMKQWYVYAAAAVPLCLALLLLPEMRRQLKNPRRPSELLVGLAAAALAVLPLRTVLVPNEIPGLTRVDFVLQIGLALLVICIGVLVIQPDAAESYNDSGKIHELTAPKSNNRNVSRFISMTVICLALGIASVLAEKLLGLRRRR
jgi:hypothetical protein